MVMRVMTDARLDTLVVGALVKFVYAVDAAHGGDVAEDDLVGADADDGAVLVKEIVDDAALAHADDVCGDPKVGDGGVPGAGEGGEGREEDAVEDESSEVEGVEGYREEEGVCVAEAGERER